MARRPVASAALAFLVMIAWSAYEYAYEESFITTPALQISNIWRAAALPAGIGLMALFALLRRKRTEHFLERRARARVGLEPARMAAGRVAGGNARRGA